MLRRSIFTLSVMCAFASVSCSGPQVTGTFTGKVTKVHDGDSIHITPKGRKRVVIRLAGIDAPELKQSYGIAARDKLRSMIFNQTAEAKCHKADRYQRQVCVVYLDDDDINLQMVNAGLAWHYKDYQNEQSRRQRRQYSKAERKARKGKLGLWAGEHIAPWVYRKMQ